MNFYKYLLPVALATCGFAASMHAADYATEQEARENDVYALREFVKSKSGISIAEKGGNLMIGGDVRSEWSHMKAITHGKKQRGHGSANLHPPAGKHAPYATNEFDIEANLMFDYRADKSWAAIQLQFDNSAGIRPRPDKDSPEYSSHKNTMFGSGSFDNLVLRKAYLGYNIMEEGTARFDVEVGRRRLRDVFDSKIQFQNFFDGLMLKYVNSYESYMDLSAKVAAFVVDQTVNHFGYVGELGFMNIADEGLDFKYSYIHWNKSGVNRFNHKHSRGNRFNISQFLLAYTFSPDMLRYKTQVYGAYLYNHAADGHKWTDHCKEASAFYVGFRVGEVKRQSDWAIDVNYQWVKPQAIPESDVSGIGRDNPRNISFYKNKSQGYANYKGYKLDGLYALTDNLTLNAIYQRVHQETEKVGGKHRSHKFQLAAIYAF